MKDGREEQVEKSRREREDEAGDIQTGKKRWETKEQVRRRGEGKKWWGGEKTSGGSGKGERRGEGKLIKKWKKSQMKEQVETEEQMRGEKREKRWEWKVVERE